MGNFLELFMKYMFVGVVVLSLFSFIIIFQSENNVSDPFVDNERINDTFTSLETNLGQTEADAQRIKDAFDAENPIAGFGSLLFFSIPAAGRVFNTMVIDTFNSVVILPVVFLGLDPVIISIMSTVLIILIILGLWAVYKLGG